MIDMEKAIEGLKHHIDYECETDEAPKKICPYWECEYCINEVMRDALELLEKQRERIERLKVNVDALLKERSSDAFEVLDNISSAYYGKQMYFMQDNGMIYDRYNCDYTTFDEAVNRFVRMVADDD